MVKCFIVSWQNVCEGIFYPQDPVDVLNFGTTIKLSLCHSLQRLEHC